jgi:hypothetical protein
MVQGTEPSTGSKVDSAGTLAAGQSAPERLSSLVRDFTIERRAIFAPPSRSLAATDAKVRLLALG